MDAQWELRGEEKAFLQALEAGEAAGALRALLPSSDASATRYFLWLLLPVVEDAALPALGEATQRMAHPDARLLAVHHLAGRCLSLGAAPPWLVQAATSALAEAGPKASAKLGPTREVLTRLLAEPSRFGYDHGLAAGARLFNAGHYFEAHEAWEDLWRPMRGEERGFFQALIDLAVALKKAEEGNPRGVARLLERTLSLLAPYGEKVRRGIDLGDLTRRLRRLLQQAEEWREGTRSGLEPADLPRLPEGD